MSGGERFSQMIEASAIIGDDVMLLTQIAPEKGLDQ
jgi:hypothetical protein